VQIFIFVFVDEIFLNFSNKKKAKYFLFLILFFSSLSCVIFQTKKIFLFEVFFVEKSNL